MSGRTWRLLLVGVVVLAGACSDDDDSADTVAPTPPPTAATTSAPTTAVETTEALTMTSEAPTTTTTTTVPPTTTSVEDIKAEVAAAYLDLDERGLDLLQHPRLRGLERRAAQVAVKGSPYFARVVERVTELIERNQYVAPNDPDHRSIIVESVDLVGERPYRRASVTVCQVTNGILVTKAEASPVPGTSVPVSGTGELIATRITLELRRTADGWRHTNLADPSDPVWQGVTECPAA